MKLLKLIWLASAVLAAAQASAANIYVLSSDDPALDDAVKVALTNGGHSVTIGVPYYTLDSGVDLSVYDAVYLQPNYNWSTGGIGVDGQAHLARYVANGGGLLTCEWAGWMMGTGSMQLLRPLLPVDVDGNFGYSPTETFVAITPNATVNQALPTSFAFNLTSYAGTQSFFPSLKFGATEFYRMAASGGYPGLAGWTYGTGRVMSFATTNGPDQLTTEMNRLLVNCFNWLTIQTPVQPVSIETIEGDEFIGNVVSIRSVDDGDYYSAFNDVDSLSCAMVVRGNSPAPVSTLHFGWATRVGRPGMALGVAMFDFVSGFYRSVSGEVAPTEFAVGAASTPLAASRFKDIAGNMRSRITWSPINDEDPSQDGWLHDVDFAGWSYE